MSRSLVIVLMLLTTPVLADSLTYTGPWQVTSQSGRGEGQFAVDGFVFTSLDPPKATGITEVETPTSMILWTSGASFHGFEDLQLVRGFTIMTPGTLDLGATLTALLRSGVVAEFGFPDTEVTATFRVDGSVISLTRANTVPQTSLSISEGASQSIPLLSGTHTLMLSLEGASGAFLGDGQATLIPSLTFHPVPEPSTWLLCVTGLVVGFIARRYMKDKVHVFFR